MVCALSLIVHLSISFYQFVKVYIFDAIIYKPSRASPNSKCAVLEELKILHQDATSK